MLTSVFVPVASGALQPVFVAAADAAIASEQLASDVAANGVTGASLSDDRYEPNDTRASAAKLGTILTTRNFNQLSLNDNADWYRFTTEHVGEAGEKVVVLFQHAQGNLRASLYDGSGQHIRTVNSSTNNETISLEGLPAGLYFLRVTGFNGDTNMNYSLRFLSDDKYEPNDTRANAADLGLINGPSRISNLALKDAADWYEFRINRKMLSSEQLRVLFANNSGNLDAALYNSNGQLIKQSVSNTNNEILGLGGLTAGTYFLRVTGRNGATNDRYSLDFRIDDRFENNDSLAGARSLGVVGDKKTIGQLALHDANDWYTFRLANPATVDAKVTIQFNHAQGNLDAELYLNGIKLRSSTSATNNEVISLSGFGTLDVQLRVFGQKNFSYKIVIENEFDDPFENNDTKATAASVTLNGLPLVSKATLSNLVLRDPDWFYFAAENIAVGTAASSVRIGFDHSQGDLDLYVYDSTGALVGKSTGTGNSEEVSLAGVALHGPNGERLRFDIRVIGKNGQTNDNYTLIVDTGFVRI
ncbi:MAG: T9SS type A sorting domain-containing protein [Pirellulaceae bacterium]|nr:T9SS type A sorting domain-containing protein [Planctomycetales bacterium]